MSARSEVVQATAAKAVTGTWSLAEMRQREERAAFDVIAAGEALASCLTGPDLQGEALLSYETIRNRYASMNGVSVARIDALEHVLARLVRVPAGEPGSVSDEQYIVLSENYLFAKEAWRGQREHLIEAMAAAPASVTFVIDGAQMVALANKAVRVTLVEYCDKNDDQFDEDSIRDVPQDDGDTEPARVRDVPVELNPERVMVLQELVDASPALALKP